ncbi:MAG: hypothetical protein RBR08_12060 [Desulforegulaceae bacterium]|nr:hypothetical protein [Desulforegulaceae bacterium]
MAGTKQYRLSFKNENLIKILNKIKPKDIERLTEYSLLLLLAQPDFQFFFKSFFLEDAAESIDFSFLERFAEGGMFSSLSPSQRNRKAKGEKETIISKEPKKESPVPAPAPEEVQEVQEVQEENSLRSSLLRMRGDL